MNGPGWQLPRAAPRFDAQYPARAFLLGVASIMARRQRRSLQRLAARLAGFARLAVHRDIAHSAEGLEREQMLSAIARAVEQLPAKKREVFVLVSWEGLSGEQAASALGIPVKTVWTRLHYARRALRAALPELAP